MVGLKKPVLVRPELFQLLLEELVLVVGYRLLVEDQDLGYVVVVDLGAPHQFLLLYTCAFWLRWCAAWETPYLFFEISEDLVPFPLDKVELL